MVGILKDLNFEISRKADCLFKFSALRASEGDGVIYAIAVAGSCIGEAQT
jgi:hypothetical protein